MKPLSILGLMLLVILAALILALFVRLRGEAFFYIVGPLLGALLGSMAYPRDQGAMITGGAVGGLCQGVIGIMVFKRGYVFQDVGIMTGTLFLASLAAHLAVGLGVGTLLYLALRWARPNAKSGGHR